jgi:hypothetical protein
VEAIAVLLRILAIVNLLRIATGGKTVTFLLIRNGKTGRYF